MFKTGDRVMHNTYRHNPKYQPGPGTVVRVTDKRVVVDWDRHFRKPMPYKPDHLKLLQSANAGNLQPVETAEGSADKKEGTET